MEFHEFTVFYQHFIMFCNNDIDMEASLDRIEMFVDKQVELIQESCSFPTPIELDDCIGKVTASCVPKLHYLKYNVN